jgi:hypothetical protein
MSSGIDYARLWEMLRNEAGFPSFHVKMAY